MAAILVLLLATPALARTAVDYDVDNDGLIEVANLAQLIAFPDAVASSATNGNLGCGLDHYNDANTAPVCTGYELKNNLDLDENNVGGFAGTSGELQARPVRPAVSDSYVTGTVTETDDDKGGLIGSATTALAGSDLRGASVYETQSLTAISALHIENWRNRRCPD